VNRAVLVATALVALFAVVAVTVVRSEPGWYQRLRYPLRYEPIVTGHARNYRLDPALLAAVIYAESKFDADARSAAGAIGLMQLLPGTAKGIALRTGGTKFEVSDLYVPELNVRYGSWYLRHLLDRYGDERLALAAYHAGQGNVDSWREQGVGVQFPETRAYVDKVMRLSRVYASAYDDELGVPSAGPVPLVAPL
jgi:soluble lytic murein transglycosylase